MKNSIINSFDCSKGIVYFFYKSLEILFRIDIKSRNIGVDGLKGIKDSIGDFNI